jgi:DNA processing protein
MRALDASHPLWRDLSKKGFAPRPLWARGELDASRRRIAIVGARAVAKEPEGIAYELARALARAGIVVVSGGARGSDRAAHEGAMAAGGVTWIVSPTGLDAPYPPEHAELFSRIHESGGAVLSAVKEQAPFFRACFQVRNRLLVALVDAVVVVQAGERSGSLGAAKAALRARTPLWVVPTSPWSEKKAWGGTLALLEAGARPFVTVEGFLSEMAIAQRPRSPRPTTLAPPSDPLERRVLEVLSKEPLHRDTIAERAGLSAAEVGAALFGLVLSGRVSETLDGKLATDQETRTA